ncbi:unnamed protein product [Lactuca saligna]|uniref:Uncharacterized protein n=1 Tax=Lactuca saligna TaxID=75948 RepID=A0AA36ENT9_LACSI|nr:unnamed protein product [Lactuca saligna]
MVNTHIPDKLRSVFAMIHRLEVFLESSYIPKQGGEGMSQSKKEDPKPSAKHTVKSKSETKGKKTFSVKNLLLTTAKMKSLMKTRSIEEKHVKLKWKSVKE